MIPPKTSWMGLLSWAIILALLGASWHGAALNAAIRVIRRQSGSQPDVVRRWLTQRH